MTEDALLDPFTESGEDVSDRAGESKRGSGASDDGTHLASGSGIEPRERDARQGPPHIATHRGDGQPEEVPQRDQLVGDSGREGGPAGESGVPGETEQLEAAVGHPLSGAGEEP